MKKLLFALAALSLFAIIGCSNDDSSGSQPEQNTSEKTEDSVTGDVTLKIQENGTGFVSSTGVVKTEFAGWTGGGYLDGLVDGGNVVYTVSAKEAITDAKIAIHYLATETSGRDRAALVSVNGKVINADSPLAMTTDHKVKKDKSSASDYKDTVYLENVSLKKGSNSIILTGAPAGTYTAANGESITIDAGNGGCLNYIDYLIVVGKGIDYGTDTTQYFSLTYGSENTTAGSVTSETPTGSVAEQTSVKLSATANTGWQFECWSNGKTENPYTFTITDNTYIFAHFIPTGATIPTGLVGYATLTADNKDAKYTITGGAGASAANTVTISSYAELVAKKDLLSSDEPKIITISGTISTAQNENPLLSEKYTIGSNSTVYGDTANQGRLRNIEFIVEGENVIIRNMMFGEVISWDGAKIDDATVKSGADDAFSLNGATHVWVDHCEFQSHLTPQDLNGNEITSSNPYYATDTSEDGIKKWQKDFYDGLLDIKNGSTWITISNCYFHDHWKACLCASGDAAPNKNTTTGATDTDMRITFYNNYWKDINARQPMLRWGKAHIFNSYFYSEATDMNGASTGINCRAGSEFYIDHNTFQNIKTPIGYYNDTSASNTGYWRNVENEFPNCTNPVDTSLTGYIPPYTWNPKTAKETVEYVKENAGVGKLAATDLQ